MPELSGARPRRGRAVGLWLLALAIIAPTRTAAGEVFPAQSVSFHLRPNGLRVILKRSPGSQIVSVSLWVRAGSRNEDAADNGTAHLLEHYLFQANSTGDSTAFDRAVEAAGGVLNGETGRDNTHYYATAPREALPLLIKTVSQIVRSPQFTPLRLDAERRRAAVEVQGRSSEVTPQVQQALFAEAYPQGAYRFPIAGTVESVSRLTLDQLRTFYQSYYRPDNASLVVVGDVDERELEAIVATDFDPWPRPSASLESARADRPHAPGTPLRRIKLEGVSRPILGVGFPAPEVSHERDSVVMDLIYTLLLSGSRSLLQTRANGLVGDLAGDYLTSKDPGLLLVWGTVQPAQAEHARRLVSSTVLSLARTISPSLLERARRVLLASYALQNETSSEQNTGLGFYDAILSYQYAVHYESTVQSITAADVERVAQRYFRHAYAALFVP